MVEEEALNCYNTHSVRKKCLRPEQGQPDSARRITEENMSYADQVFIHMCRDIIDNGTSTEGEKGAPCVGRTAPPPTPSRSLGVVKQVRPVKGISGPDPAPDGY